MLDNKVKFKCSDCKAVFEKHFFETLHTSLIKCPECGSLKVKNMSDYSVIADFLKKIRKK
jgi:DNA-directed RNA polymerase subunit RPC12/RpoP